VIQRALREWGYACDVTAPLLIPKRPGVQRKHDKCDAVELARPYRSGELTAVRIPSEADERVRGVVRCRDTFQGEVLKSRHYILKRLARRGFVFREGTNWCTPQLKWLQHLTTKHSALAPEDRLVFGEYYALLMDKLQRRDELDRQIEQLALLPTLAPLVAPLQCFRGIALQSAMVLATEMSIGGASTGRHNWRATWAWCRARIRVGIANDSGRLPRRATRIVAMCSCKRRGVTGIVRRPVELKRRQQDQPPAVITHAWKAQQWLPQGFMHLTDRKRPQIAAVAVARELVGFLWQ
jgi:transposase